MVYEQRLVDHGGPLKSDYNPRDSTDVLSDPDLNTTPKPTPEGIICI